MRGAQTPLNLLVRLTRGMISAAANGKETARDERRESAFGKCAVRALRGSHFGTLRYAYNGITRLTTHLRARALVEMSHCTSRLYTIAWKSQARHDDCYSLSSHVDQNNAREREIKD